MNADPASTILIVQDEGPARTLLADELTADGHAILVAADARMARHRLETQYPDLVLLDAGLADGSGLDLLRTIRESDRLAGRMDPRVALIVLTARSGETDRLRAFARGADDVVGVPFSYPELLARAEALLRRCAGRPRSARLRVGPVELDPASHEVRLHGDPVHLSHKEFSLLRVLASEPGRVFTKDELMRTVWGFRATSTTRTLDSHACRLRGKLSAGGERFVHNVWGVGYRLVDGVAAAA